jgi:hypothetical protein
VAQTEQSEERKQHLRNRPRQGRGSEQHAGRGQPVDTPRPQREYRAQERRAQQEPEERLAHHVVLGHEQRAAERRQQPGEPACRPAEEQPPEQVGHERGQDTNDMLDQQQPDEALLAEKP